MAVNPTDKLCGARLKIERAKEHVAELDRALRAFYDTKPYKIGTKRDAQTRKLIYYVSSVEPTPCNIPIIAGDAIHNLRSALDQLAYALFTAGPGGKSGAPSKHVYFPIFSDAAKYQAEVIGKIKGADPLAIKAIDGIEPYKGGKGHQLWVLNALDIADKHRQLMTVGSAFRSINLGGAFSDQIFAKVGITSKFPDVFFRAADRLCPLKTGDELFVDAPDAELNEEMEFRFEIALAEPEIPNGEPLLETIHHLTNLVSGILTQFEPFF